MITHNHEQFVAQAVASVLSQQTPFEVELVVGEDSSTDSTRQIIARYAQQHASIHAIFQERNLGAQANLELAMSACRGEYIAFLEGDDYWTDPTKLARQVAVLDANVGAALCYHEVEVVDERGSQIAAQMNVGGRGKGRLTVDDFLRGRHIPTCSVVGRKGAYSEYPRWLHELGMSDWPLHILAARHGFAAYVPGGGAAYRRHAAGAWSGGSRTYISWLAAAARMYDHLTRVLDLEYQSSVVAGRASLGPKLAGYLDEVAERETSVTAALQRVVGALSEWPEDLELPDAEPRTLKGDFVAKELYRRYLAGDRGGTLAAAAILPCFRPQAPLAKGYWSMMWKTIVGSGPESSAPARR